MKANAEQIIRESIAKVQADGWTVAAWKYRDDGMKTCCPIGAVAIANGTYLESMADTAVRVLGLDINSTERQIFTSTFDGKPICGNVDPLAHKLRAEFITSSEVTQ